MIKNKKYFVKKIKEKVAQDFMSIYHCAHSFSKNSKYDLGIFRIDTNELIGVGQFERSSSSELYLSKYIKNDIEKGEYLQLSYFAMKDTEEKNSESSGLSLLIKWIKKNLPFIRLLITFAGEEENNYGYIFQATNWNYLGQSIIDNYWRIDGIGKILQDDIIERSHHDIHKIRCKRLIYITIIDKKVFYKNPPLPYPKKNQGSIIIEDEIIKEDKKWFEKYQAKREEYIFIYKEEDNKKRYSKKCFRVGVYDEYGNLEKIYNSFLDVKRELGEEWNYNCIRRAAKNHKKYKNKFFTRERLEKISKKIDVKPICEIEGFPLYTREQIQDYVQISRQGMYLAMKNKSKTIKNKEVVWF